MGKTREPILVEAPEFLKKAFKDFMIMSYKQTYYQKNDDGYLFYCKNCGEMQQLSKDQFKKVRNTDLCPNCFYSSKLHRKPYPKKFEKHELLGWMDDNGNRVGYYCSLKENSFFIKQVAYWSKNSRGNDEFWARYIQKTMGDGITYDERLRPEFTKRHKSWYGYYSCLEDRFSWIMEGKEQRYGCFYESKTYKQYLCESLDFDLYKLKSNQIYLIKNNLFNTQQVKAIYYFDLKKPEEVFKYKNYISGCSFARPRVLNIHYLDYLSKYKIPYAEFMDYARDLEMLGYKLDKPKDFYDRHEKVGELIEIKNDEKYRKGIERNFRKLKKKKLDSKNYSIKPIESLEEINYVAKSLHNCMARMYTKPYSKGETDLYCLWIDGKPFIAIEVLKGKLEQIRADHNKDPERKYKIIVNKWFRGAYAN